MLYQQLLRLLSFFIFFIFSHGLYAGNWNASVSSSIQTDNRYSSSSHTSADALLNYAYDDSENDLHGRLNVLVNQSDSSVQNSFESGNELYELSIEKGWAEYNTRIKAGRFERSDNLGFYFLDGLNLNYQNNQQDFSFELYLGKPGRIDEANVINGDYLFGLELFHRQTNPWDNALVDLIMDSWDMRMGLQKLKDSDMTAHRINFAFNSEGKSQKPDQKSHCQLDCQRFKSQLLLTYHTEKNTLEDLYADVRIPVTQDLRLRFSYEYYRPDVDSDPGFREQFYSYYDFGDQKLTQINIDYFINKQTSIFVQWIQSDRETGDTGIGYASGINLKQPFPNLLDLDISLSMDRVELGNDTLNSVYFNLEHHINSRLNIQLDSIYREEKKPFFGDNKVFGLSGKVNYMFKNDLIFSFEAREINNTRLRDEHLARLTMTYYFDNFKAKSRMH